jgi:hypothetical protein
MSARSWRAGKRREAPSARVLANGGVRVSMKTCEMRIVLGRERRADQTVLFG